MREKNEKRTTANVSGLMNKKGTKIMSKTSHLSDKSGFKLH